MNEDLVLQNNADQTSPSGSDPIPPSPAEEKQILEPSEVDPTNASHVPEENVELSPSTGEDSDPDLASPSEETAEDGLEQLRSELKALRQSLAERDAFFSRLGAECEEFSSLFPTTALSEIPDGVWEDVRHGIPLAAAYALAERRRVRTEELAAKSNLENRQRSTGAVSGAREEYFSPSEVRRMSQDEVRANYSKIMTSMKNWR